jgi:hypothetical protein
MISFDYSEKIMPDFDLFLEEPVFQPPPQIPQEWIVMVCKLHPLTAAVVWQVLTSMISPSTITLAQHSPDRGRFMLVNLVALGNANDCEELTRLARQEVDEILLATVPGYHVRKLVH